MSKQKNKHTTNSARETEKLAAKILKGTEKQNKPKARVFALSGNLGAGKTQFVKGAAKHFGIKRNITSPTFVIMKRYGNFYHFDCYRVENKEEVLELGWLDVVSKRDNIVFVEWPEKIKEILPKDVIWVKIRRTKENEREIILEQNNE